MPMPMLDLTVFNLPPLGTNAFLLRNPETAEAIVIDAPLGMGDAVVPLLGEGSYKLVAIVLTHGHFDHILGVAELAGLQAPVWAHPAEADFLSNPQAQLDLFQLPLRCEPVAVDRWLEPGTTKLLGESMEVRHVPGHSPGSLAFYFPSLATAFVGDTVFAGGAGRTDLPGGDPDALPQAVVNQIFTLPPKTTLYPGHGPATDVATERHDNPFFRV